ncbi:hypothetical protein ACFLSY_04750 [Bacteroidota bacterium]
MPRNNSDPLFHLIKSLSKSEKRYFKLFVTRQKDTKDTKFLSLFYIIDKQLIFDEDLIIKKNPELKRSQLPNMKAYLYKQILSSLRNYNPNNDLEIKMREMIDHAKILYNRCLYEQCYKMLKKAKTFSKEYDKQIFLMEITDLEKRLVTKLIRTNDEHRVGDLVKESDNAYNTSLNINNFYNLWIRFYSFYLNFGFIRDQKDFENVTAFLYSGLPVFEEEDLSFDEKMYLYNSLIAYYFFIQDFKRGYEYSQKCLSLFEDNQYLIIPKLEFYIKAVNNLMTAQSKLSKLDEFTRTAKKFNEISNLSGPSNTFNNRLLLFKYSSTHKINRFYMLGEFSEGVKIVPRIADQLEKFSGILDEHYTMIFYYKFACMYFGNEDYSRANYWLNKIINSGSIDFRSDIQSFARILNLICHYELGNAEQMEYYIRSTYRFIMKKESLQQFQKIILRFLKKLSYITTDQLNENFADLIIQLKVLSKDPYQKRAFIYFDSISWLESKIVNRPVQEIIKEKALKKIQLAEE